MTQMRHPFFYALVLSAVVLTSGCSRKVSAFSNGEPEADITGSESDPAVEFKAELKPDRRYAFHLETDNSYRSSKWKFGTDSGETHFESDYFLSITNENSKGHKLLDVEFKTLVLQVYSGDESKLYYDSENHAVPMVGEFADAMRNMLHSHCGVELSRHESLVRVTGLDQAIAAATSNKKLRKSEPWIRRLFATTTIRYMVELNHLPDKPVKIGAKWKQTDALDNGLQANSEYIFRGWQWHNERRCALIEFDGAVTTAKEKNKGSVENGPSRVSATSISLAMADRLRPPPSAVPRASPWMRPATSMLPTGTTSVFAKSTRPASSRQWRATGRRVSRETPGLRSMPHCFNRWQ